MTRKDIFIKMISEACEVPAQQAEDLLNNFRHQIPGGQWDTPIPDKDAEALLEDLRRNPDVIRDWVARGRNHGKTVH